MARTHNNSRDDFPHILRAQNWAWARWLGARKEVLRVQEVANQVLSNLITDISSVVAKVTVIYKKFDAESWSSWGLVAAQSALKALASFDILDALSKSRQECDWLSRDPSTTDLTKIWEIRKQIDILETTYNSLLALYLKTVADAVEKMMKENYPVDKRFTVTNCRWVRCNEEGPVINQGNVCVVIGYLKAGKGWFFVTFQVLDANGNTIGEASRYFSPETGTVDKGIELIPPA